MDMIQKVINGIIDFIKKNLKIAIIAGIVVLALIGLKIGLKAKQDKINKIPIEKITATCDYEFKTSTKLTDNLEYFQITAIREGGVESSIDTEGADITLSQEYVNPYGETTQIELTYTDNDGKEYKCKVDVPNSREKIVGFQCGYPSVADVVAVLYSNGELCFEGEGDTLVFYEGEYPWLTNWWDDVGIEEENATQIKSVTFEKKVTPTNLNYAFEGCESLIYVGEIPSSVRTMVKTFAGCTNLKNAADVGKAEVLLNMNSTYEGCTSLVNANVIPQNVRVAKACFKDCTNLQICANMENAEKIVKIDNMYENCQKLTSVTLREGITSMRYTFAECINLKQLSAFPSTVKYMDGTFSGDVSLSKFEFTIPQTVVSMNECFLNCEILAGEIYIDCNIGEFDKMFEGACQATKINLLGNSMLLDAYANTNDMDNVYVNSLKPNTSITSYGDIFE